MYISPSKYVEVFIYHKINKIMSEEASVEPFTRGP